MAKETQIGKLVIDLQIKTQALEKGLETAKKKLQEIEKENKQIESSNKSLQTSFVAMSAGIVVALIGIKNATTDAVNEYSKYKNSMMTVNKIAENTGNTLKDVQNILNNTNELKLMNQSDLNSAIKNLLLYGYTAEQATDILNRLQDSAVGNRQECYTLSEAVRVTTEGIRMENSVLSDAAGVQKNIAKMYEEHATKIGKSTDALTQAEKAQAVYNGIMQETEPLVGAAKDMAEEYAGQQAQLEAINLEMKQTLGEALTPAYTELTKIQKTAITGITEFIKEHKTGTAGTITFTTAVLGISVAVTAAKKGYAALTKGIVAYKAAAAAANMTTATFTATLLANPLFWGVAIAAGTITAINMINTKMEESIEKNNTLTEQLTTLDEAVNNFGKNYEYTEQESKVVDEAKKEAEEIVKVYEEKTGRIKQLQDEIQSYKDKGGFLEFGLTQQDVVLMNQAEEELQKLTAEQKRFEEENLSNGRTIESYRKKVDVLSKTLEMNKDKQEYSRLTNIKSNRETLINIAQTKADIDGKRKLLEVLKKGKTETSEYADAKNQLVKVYPELVKVNENTINSTEATIDAEERAAQSEWALAQATIMNTIAELTAMQNNDAQVQSIADATKQKVEDVRASIEAATASLFEMSKLTVDDFKGSVTSNYTPKAPSRSSSSGSYSNKLLDNYKKEIEHLKAMDQISLRQEIIMYETALQKYAKTADEKMELREKIYELNKELAKKEKEILEQQTEDYEAYIQEQKNLRGAEYDIKDQTRDYDKIIAMHKNYLNQIMKDERLSLEERKEIYREELQTIREYEQQKRDLRVEAIDSTVSQLTSAITKQLEEMYDKDKELIDKNLEDVEKWKEERINAINEEYDARIEAIEKELEALDKAEQQKTRDEEDAEYEKKKLRLQQLIEFEHDATNRANYQKELDKLVAEYQKTLDARALEDKKEALNEQKELLQQEQDDKLQAIEDETDKRKEEYEKQLDDLEKYYDEQIDKAQETAEKMLLNVEQNQEQILSLLQSYGDAYEITGQTLGEKLAQGINEGLASKIESAIQNFQDTIDRNLEIKIAEWEKARTQYEAGAGKSQTQSINIYQTNNIEQNPELPSETYRKLRNISEELAAQLSV